MKVLVAYESKYGATEEIVERIARVIAAREIGVDILRARDVKSLAGYDAFVIGSAVYYGSWVKEATDLVLRERVSLATRPVWLFSSGPVGPATDKSGRDAREVAIPKTLADLRAVITPRDHRVFFGALDRKKMGFADRMIASMPAFPGAEGDFRDWQDIETWAASIAETLASAPVSGPALVAAT